MEIYEKGLGLNFVYFISHSKRFGKQKSILLNYALVPPHTAFLLLPPDRRWMSECATIGGVLFTLEIKCNMSKINIKNK